MCAVRVTPGKLPFTNLTRAKETLMALIHRLIARKAIKNAVLSNPVARRAIRNAIVAGVAAPGLQGVAAPGRQRLAARRKARLIAGARFL
jgi:hypothetical protein